MGKHKDSLPGGINSARVNGGSHTPGGRYGYRREWLKEEAEKRAEARASRSAQEQLALLDQRLGAGVGAKKERARLAAQVKGQ